MTRITFTLLIILILPLTVFAQSGGTIAYGETVTGTISDDDSVHVWAFEGSAGDIITLSMSAVDLAEGGLDSYLQLLDPSGSVIAENDDASNATVDSRIEEFTLPADGTYTIHATRFGQENGLSVGDYELSLELVSGESPPPTSSAPTTESGSTIGYDEPVTGTLNRQVFEQRWTFEGTAGDVITIRMERVDENSDLDTFIRLLDNEDNELARNDDSEEGTRSSEIIGFELPYTGTYTIVATRFGFESGTSSGDYQLEIMSGAGSPTQEAPAVEAVTIAYGDFVNGTLESGAALYEFQGAAGDVVTISVKRASGDLNPSLELADNTTNTLVAQNFDFNGPADARLVDITLPSDGTYTIAILPETGGSGDFVLHIFNVEAAAAEPEAESEPETQPETEPEAETQPESEPEAEIVEQEPLDLSDATLVITVQWEGTADFDLAVVDPDGNRLDYFTTSSESGGLFGGDANGGCALTSTTPSETAYWETEPPAGTYSIDVAHVFPCDEESPVAFTVEISLNGEVLETIEDELNEGELATYEFTLE